MDIGACGHVSVSVLVSLFFTLCSACVSVCLCVDYVSRVTLQSDTICVFCAGTTARER